jgi:putative transposase
MKRRYSARMLTTLTAKLKLHTTPDQFRALRLTPRAYREALNFVSRSAFEHGKMSNRVGLQEGTYQDIRSRFGLPAQMACSVSRQVGATYKTLGTKVKTNATALKAGLTKKRYRGLDQPPKYVSPTLTYQLGHDYGFKTAQRVSILTLDGRHMLPYTGYARHVSLIREGARIGAAKLWYDQPRKPFYLLVSLQRAVAEPTPEAQRRLVGVDVGQRYLAVTTDTQDNMAFFPGTAVRAQADHYARLRKRLQHKGTRSATQRLIVVSGRERRLKHERNHLISGASWTPIRMP